MRLCVVVVLWYCDCDIGIVILVCCYPPDTKLPGPLSRGEECVRSCVVAVSPCCPLLSMLWAMLPRNLRSLRKRCLSTAFILRFVLGMTASVLSNAWGAWLCNGWLLLFSCWLKALAYQQNPWCLICLRHWLAGCPVERIHMRASAFGGIAGVCWTCAAISSNL